MYLIWLLIPFIGTMLGSALIFFTNEKINDKYEKILLAFSAGIMLSATFFALLIPSIEFAEKQNMISFLPASIGFLLGIVFLYFIENYCSKNLSSNKSSKMIFAITLHNIPEGMAVGVVLSDLLLTGATSYNMLLALTVGVAIQNIPEGLIVALKCRNKGLSKFKSFIYGTMSGIVEPIFGILTLILTSLILKVLPYCLSFAAGAMIYVIVCELIPESISERKSIIFLSFGFILMMILDVYFG